MLAHSVQFRRIKLSNDEHVSLREMFEKQWQSTLNKLKINSKHSEYVNLHEMQQ